MNKQKRILIAPLDWGLGHATRCIAIANELLKYNVEVVFASDNRPYELLRKEFPKLEHLRFPGYSVKYITKGSLALAVAQQLPSILYGFKKEHKLVESLIEAYKIDSVISDSRFGAYSKNIPSIFLIHQLNIILPYYLQWGEKIVAAVNRYLCNQYSECWVSDFPGEMNIGGKLSHPDKLPHNTFYIGPVSRLTSIGSEKNIDILAILSGPEPQRSIFERMIIDQLRNTNLRAVIIKGTSEQSGRYQLTEYITLIDVAQSEELSKLIASSKIILSRGGYVSLMDFAIVGAKVIIVPTPQQTEQEYTAKELMKKKICYYESQDKFSLERSLERAKEYKGFAKIHPDSDVLNKRIENLLSTIGY